MKKLKENKSDLIDLSFLILSNHCKMNECKNCRFNYGDRDYDETRCLINTEPPNEWMIYYTLGEFINE